MGNEVFNELNPYQYHVFITKPIHGETGILVRPDSTQGLSDKNYIGKYTQIDCLEYQKTKRPNSNFLGTREYNPITKKHGKYIWKTYAQVYELATFFLYGITKYNLCPEISLDDDILGKNTKMKLMGFYTRTSEEWIIASLGCQLDSITIVTLYETLGLASMEFILKQTELTTILSNSIYLETILKLKEDNKIGNVKNIIYITFKEENVNLEDTKEKLKNLGLNLISYETIMETGKKSIEEKDHEILDKNFKKISPQHIQLICYTSGTTNNPKGVMIPAKSIALSSSWEYNIGYHPSGKDRALSFLPFAHIVAHILFTIDLVFGVQIGFYSGDTGKLIEDAQELQPTFFCGVPRIYEKLYQTIMNTIDKKGALFKKIFKKALSIKIHNCKKYGKLSHAFFDKFFFSEIKNLLGGKIVYMMSCGATMNKEIMQILKIMFGCYFVEGFGQTEGGGSCIMSNIYDNHLGTVGGVVNTLELKLVDLPKMGYLSTDVNPKTGIPEPRGEICYRGEFISKKKKKNIEETNKTFDKDGWLHSGDVGIILTKNGNALKIIDRVKSLFKLNQGEYVSPEKVQKILINSKYINQIFLHGESQYNYAVALVYPELKECVEFLKENKKLGDIDYNKISYDDLWGNKIMEDEIVKDCNIIGRKSGLKGFELPKKIRIINEGFSIQNNLMTSLLKLIPRNIRKKFKDDLKKLYEEKL